MRYTRRTRGKAPSYVVRFKPDDDNYSYVVGVAWTTSHGLAMKLNPVVDGQRLVYGIFYLNEISVRSAQTELPAEMLRGDEPLEGPAPFPDLDEEP